MPKDPWGVGELLGSITWEDAVENRLHMVRYITTRKSDFTRSWLTVLSKVTPEVTITLPLQFCLRSSYLFPCSCALPSGKLMYPMKPIPTESAAIPILDCCVSMYRSQILKSINSEKTKKKPAPLPWLLGRVGKPPIMSLPLSTKTSLDLSLVIGVSFCRHNIYIK